MAGFAGEILSVPVDETLKQLEAFRRDPFREILSSALNAQPTHKNIQNFANKSPDRYAQFIAIFAKLAGYNDKIEVDVKGLFAIAQLSDSELQALIDRGNNGGNSMLPIVDKVTTSTG